MSLCKGDKSAAFVGLIGGAITILLLVYGMVLLTNASFEGHEAAAPAAEHGN
jgi:hypothetical protein